MKSAEVAKRSRRETMGQLGRKVRPANRGTTESAAREVGGNLQESEQIRHSVPETSRFRGASRRREAGKGTRERRSEENRNGRRGGLGYFFASRK